LRAVGIHVILGRAPENFRSPIKKGR